MRQTAQQTAQQTATGHNAEKACTRDRFYKIVRNKAKKMEFKTVDLNLHSSLRVEGRKIFEKVYTREMARYDFFKLLCKVDNKEASFEDLEKIELLQGSFPFTRDDDCTSLEGLPDVLVPMMILALWSQGAVISEYVQKVDSVTGEPSEKWEIHRENVHLEMYGLYSTCKKVIPEIMTGAQTLEGAVDIIKEEYRKSVHIIDHPADSNICKAWKESDKEHKTRAFVVGLLDNYKLTRSNRLKVDSPLKSQETFEKYVASWIISEGVEVTKKKKSRDAVTFDTMVKRYTK